MNFVQQKRFRVPIVFDSSESYEYYDSYDSYEYEDQDSEREHKNSHPKEIKMQPIKNNVQKLKLNRSMPIYPAANPPIIRPRSNSIDIKENPPPEHKNNEQNKQEQATLQNNKSVFEIDQTEFVDSHTYALVVHKESKLFKKTKTFTLLDNGKEIHKVKIDSRSCKKVILPNDIVMYIRQNRTEFILKTNNKQSKSLAKISFSIPFIYEECKRKTAIRFNNTTDGMLPNKIVSLPTVGDAVFNNHYYIKSKRNVSFAIVNNSKPVLSARQIRKNMMEIDTILNIPTDILFGIALALYCGKNETDANTIDTENMQKFQVLNLQRLMRNT